MGVVTEIRNMYQIPRGSNRMAVAGFAGYLFAKVLLYWL
jgi:hypothetical protein